MPDRRQLVALDTPFAIEFDEDPVFAPLVRAIVASYPATERAPALRYRICAEPMGAVWRDDRELYRSSDARDIAPAFELDLYREVSERAGAGWLLHAAAVRTERGALVIAGPSGAGKTTLCLALLARGHAYVTEEMVLLDGAGRTRGLTRPLHLPADDPRLGDRAGGLARVEYEMRGSAGVVHHVLLVPSREMTCTETLPLHALIRVGHQASDGGCKRLSPAAALVEMWPATLRQDAAALEIAAEVMRTHPIYELRATSIAEALVLAEGVIAS